MYAAGAARAEARGIIIADTKLELGFVDGRLVLADEVLTPDSSRFWPADEWKPGVTPPAFDKQPRARLARGAAAGTSARRPLLFPTRSSRQAAARYVEGYERITGLDFADWPGASPAL